MTIIHYYLFLQLCSSMGCTFIMVPGYYADYTACAKAGFATVHAEEAYKYQCVGSRAAP